jgi:hypothetical protein
MGGRGTGQRHFSRLHRCNELQCSSQPRVTIHLSMVSTATRMYQSIWYTVEMVPPSTTCSRTTERAWVWFIFYSKRSLGTPQICYTHRSASSVVLRPYCRAMVAYVATACNTLGLGPYRDSASAYLPRYLLRRASAGPPPGERYLPCVCTEQSSCNGGMVAITMVVQ